MRASVRLAPQVEAGGMPRDWIRRFDPGRCEGMTR
jgi:hypothetical protein